MIKGVVSKVTLKSRADPLSTKLPQEMTSVIVRRYFTKVSKPTTFGFEHQAHVVRLNCWNLPPIIHGLSLLSY